MPVAAGRYSREISGFERTRSLAQTHNTCTKPAGLPRIEEA